MEQVIACFSRFRKSQANLVSADYYRSPTSAMRQGCARQYQYQQGNCQSAEQPSEYFRLSHRSFLSQLKMLYLIRSAKTDTDSKKRAAFCLKNEGFLDKKESP
jgi:hypothetical protein